MKNIEIMKVILEKIKEYDRIMLFRHVRNDGDCVGATKGLKAIIQLTWPEKEVYLIDEETARYLDFLGPEDAPVADELYADALGIVLDTASEARISNRRYTLCKELIKIDHHIPLESYGDYVWVEEERSSACEMVVKFYNAFKMSLRLIRRLLPISIPEWLPIPDVSATAMLTAILCDTPRFFWMWVWIRKHYLHACIWRLLNISNSKLTSIRKCRLLKMVSPIFTSIRRCRRNLDSIRGCICWIAFIESGDENGSIRVRLRSRFVHINSIAENYRGGGHACASGATVYNRDEVESLLHDADAHVKEYKATHEGWL